MTAGDVQDNISRYWTKRATSYNGLVDHPDHREAERETWAKVWARALPAPPLGVLDVGTGTGHVALLLAGLGYRVTGIDAADGMVAEARRRAQGMTDPPRLMSGDAVDPPFGDACFDVITARWLLWTLRRPAEALARWRTLLRAGGLLAIVDRPWFPDGIPADPGPQPSTWAADFRSLYDDRVLAELPLAQARGIEDTAELVRAAGFRDVTVTALHDVLEFDRALGWTDEHPVELHYLITATA